MIKMIISPEYFGVNEKKNAIKEQIKGWGAKNISIDEDTGYISALMSFNDYNEFVLSLRRNVILKADEIASDNEKYPSITDIKYSGDMSTFDVMCFSTIGSEKNTAALELYMVSASYQVLSGIPQEQLYVRIYFIDNSNGNLLDVMNTSDLIRK